MSAFLLSENAGVDLGPSRMSMTDQPDAWKICFFSNSRHLVTLITWRKFQWNSCQLWPTWCLDFLENQGFPQNVNLNLQLVWIGFDRFLVKSPGSCKPLEKRLNGGRFLSVSQRLTLKLEGHLLPFPQVPAETWESIPPWEVMLGDHVKMYLHRMNMRDFYYLTSLPNGTTNMFIDYWLFPSLRDFTKHQVSWRNSFLVHPPHCCPIPTHPPYPPLSSRPTATFPEAICWKSICKTWATVMKSGKRSWTLIWKEAETVKISIFQMSEWLPLNVYSEHLRTVLLSHKLCVFLCGKKGTFHNQTKKNLWFAL